jgi:kynurenine formamidase
MKYFDLSVPLYHNCPGWPTYRLTEFNLEKVHGNDGFIAERIDLNTHTGTHLDAPYHFFPRGKTIDEIPLEAFIGRARIINLKGIAARTGIGPEHLEKHLAKVQKGDIVLYCTGWAQKRRHSPEYYHDWPYLTQEGAELLLAKGVKGVGTDGMSIGGWYEGTGRPCHEALLGNGIWLVEELIFPKELLKHESCTFTAVPLNLRGFGGSPTRAFAVVE